MKAQALLGGREFETFSIDLTTRRHIDSPVDQVALKPIIDHETLRDLPSVPTTPIENHLADKVCALYEWHGQDGDKASTRYATWLTSSGSLQTSRSMPPAWPLSFNAKPAGAR
ncbi:hypothetical protein G3I17_35830 [Streptomyces sp. SID13031]|nr:hypothetical protein [Streptomyces sp. SID13031]